MKRLFFVAAFVATLIGSAMAAQFGKQVVSGSFTATGQSASFMPVVSGSSRGEFNVSIQGTFVGTVQLERSLNDGQTWEAVTVGGSALYVWTAPASEMASEVESGAAYRLNCTAYTSGTITYRLSQ